MPPCEHAVAEDAVVGVAGDVQDFEVGTRGGEARGEFAAAQAGHDDVGDEQLNFSCVGGGDFEGLHGRRLRRALDSREPRGIR